MIHGVDIDLIVWINTPKYLGSHCHRVVKEISNQPFQIALFRKRGQPIYRLHKLPKGFSVLHTLLHDRRCVDSCFRRQLWIAEILHTSDSNKMLRRFENNGF